MPAEMPQEYERAALDYLRRLPLEHFMEATSQATQREITLESFDLLPLPAELQAELQKERRELENERAARLAAEEENARLRAELERLRGNPGS